MPGSITDPPAVERFCLRTEPGAEREDPLQFRDALATIAWLRPMQQQNTALGQLRDLLRRDAAHRTVVEQRDPAIFLKEFAELLKKGEVLYRKDTTKKLHRGGAGGGAGGESSSSTSTSSSKTVAPPPPPAPQRAAAAAGSGSPKASVMVPFDPQPPKVEPDPLDTPPPGPGRETAGNTH